MSSEQTRKQKQIGSVMTAAPVIAVVVVNTPRSAVTMARALVSGGLPVIEVTLRTADAIDCLAAIVSEVEGAICGAGTVLSSGQLAAVEKSGASFAVSPGVSPGLLAAADDSRLPLLPGAATASEMMALGERGYRHLKFFPAEPAGGLTYLKALASPLPQFRFCPTGGITPASAPNYLALTNVLCVGGSWMAPPSLVECGDTARLEALAKNAAALRPTPTTAPAE
jgi:2-dehydro-3-deoxyphosphogluconate aldolase / (4S)-4-hydroxy-2-oxoglutarate aldolase